MIHSGEPIANPAMTLQTFVRLLKKFHSVFFLDQIYLFAYSYSILLPDSQRSQLVQIYGGWQEGKTDCKFILGHPEAIRSLSFLAGFSLFPFVFPQRTLHTWLLNQGQGNVKHINLSMKQSLNVDKRKSQERQTDKINITD